MKLFARGMELSKRERKHMVAWNCNLNTNLEFTEYSLMAVGQCSNISSLYKEPVKKRGQVIQKRKVLEIETIECKLIASFYTAYCSWHAINGYRLWDSQGQVEKINLELSRSECENAIDSHALKYQDRLYYAEMSFLTIQLSPENTGSGWKTLRGEADSQQGTCKPDKFNIGRQHFPSHVLFMKYEIEIKRKPGIFNIERRLLRINEHLVIPDTLTGSYFSPLYGNFHWEKIDEGNLTINHWVEISNGQIDLFYPTNMNTSKPIAILSTSAGPGLAISLERRTSLCLAYSCRESFTTQMNDIYLMVYEPTGQSRWNLQPAGGTEISRLANLEATMTSIYISNELKLSKSFERISTELCERNRETIKSNIQDYLTNIFIEQDKNGDHGRYFVKAGSVLYSIKCKEQLAWLRGNDTRCYEDAPVYYEEGPDNVLRSGFIDPITNIIKPKSKYRTCNDILPFKLSVKGIDGTTEWLCKGSNGWDTNCRAPKILKPMHPGSLYESENTHIQPTLYNNQQINSLEEFQWKETNSDSVLAEWDNYLQKIKRSNPNTTTIDYFDGIIGSIQNMVEIFSHIYIIKILMKQLLPIIVVNYVFNVAYNLSKALINTRKTYKKKGLGLNLILDLCFKAISSFFPMYNKKEKQIECPCKTDRYIEEMLDKIEDRERQKFLKDLQF